MKHLLLILSLILLGCGGGEKKQEETHQEDDMVYICNGSSSKRYHATDECRGLCNCRGGVKAVTLSQAEKMGRTPCQICY